MHHTKVLDCGDGGWQYGGFSKGVKLGHSTARVWLLQSLSIVLSCKHIKKCLTVQRFTFLCIHRTFLCLFLFLHFLYFLIIYAHFFFLCCYISLSKMLKPKSLLTQENLHLGSLGCPDQFSV